MSLNRLPTSIDTLVGTIEFEAQRSDDKDHDGVSNKASQHARAVARVIDGSEDAGADDAADGASPNEGCRGEGALPLAADVVRLVGQKYGAVGVTRDSRQEDAKVADTTLLNVTQQTETDDAFTERKRLA